MPMPGGRGKRILRMFVYTLAAILVFFVMVLVSSRVATDAVFQGMANARATGLSASMMELEPAQSPRLIQSADDLEIVRMASLLLQTRGFDVARSRIESIVQSHQGHFDQLQVRARQDSGRTLIATIRVPVENFDSTLDELKLLGDAEDETQNSVSSSAESDRLDAKLAATRVTENRLNRLLQEHTGKLGEYLEVEQEIAKVRGEIEDLDAQQRRHTQRVRYGVVRVSVKEEFAAHFAIERAGIASRLRSSIVEGLQAVIEQGSAALSFMLLVVPSLLFWVALLFLPARFGWRRARAFVTRKATAVPLQS